MPLPAFKAYDIRGRVPEELNEDLARRIGVALAAQLAPGPVVLGHDVRLTSPALQDALAAGLRGTGREVIDIGLCGTEEVYFQTDHLNAAGGVMVTASHNPMDYNGMKLVKENARPISSDTGLFAISDAVAADTAEAQPPRAGQVAQHDKSAYIQHLLSYVDAGKLKPLKLVVNAGNGGAGAIVDLLAPHLPFEFIRICHEPDGSFPMAFPIRCCRRTAPPPPTPYANMAPISASRGTVTSIAASSSTTAAASSRATTWSACWPRRSWRAIPAARSCMTRAWSGTPWTWSSRPVACQCSARAATPSSRKRCVPKTRCTAAR